LKKIKRLDSIETLKLHISWRIKVIIVQNDRIAEMLSLHSIQGTIYANIQPQSSSFPSRASPLTLLGDFRPRLPLIALLADRVHDRTYIHACILFSDKKKTLHQRNTVQWSGQKCAKDTDNCP